MDELTAKERVLQVFPQAVATKFELGMDSVQYNIVIRLGGASGFFMQDVEEMAWKNAASALPPPKRRDKEFIQ